MEEVQRKWDQIYLDQFEQPQASEVLAQNLHLLPINGVALDLACGLGANSLLLAQQGLEVSAWDISSVAIERVQEEVERLLLPVHAEVRDVVAEPPQAEQFDVIVVSHFLDRSLAQDLMAALKPGGLLFYQTFCRDKVFQVGPNNPDYLLADNELIDLFSPLKLRVYREDALIGNLTQGWRNQAMYIGQKQISHNRLAGWVRDL